jgi:hypothetical protein
MGFKCGIVGLPNVGKSTLFNALTKAKIEASNYPFCTIEPNLGMVTVPDPRLEALSEIVKPERVVPAVMQIVDIAGLVKGASKGEGLGNQFLANIRETDAILHVVRCFSQGDIVHVEGRVDPMDDMAVINTELALCDLDTVEKASLKSLKNSKSGNKEAIIESQLLDKLKQHLNTGAPARTLEMTVEEQAHLRRFCLLTAKPVLYIANIDEDCSAEDATLLAKVKAQAALEKASVVELCAATEAALMEFTDALERDEFMQALGLSEPGLHRVIRAGYALLGLQTYFTAGVKEVRAWTVKQGARAPEAAAVIHTDFEKGFIRAEVTAYADFVAYGGEQGARDAGKLRLEGKEYRVQDGDVMHFRFNV